MNVAGLVLLSIATAAVAHTSLQAQEPEAPTLSVNVQVVAINALVRTRDGALVHSLDKADFALRVDGHPTDIRYFSRDSDLPLSIGLMIDTSGSQRTFLDDEARASDIFLREMITQPTDRALVFAFDAQISFLQPLTARLPELHNALRRLDYPTPGDHASGTLLYDAIVDASHAFRNAVPGRRALILLTDGGDNGSRARLPDAIRAAQLADIAVYSILYTSEMIGATRYPVGVGGQVSGIDVMQQLAHATGGRSFVVGNGTSINEIYASIAEDLRSQYRLGFTPAPAKPGKSHSIDLRPTGDLAKRLTIQSRQTYITPE